jgi:heme/copper-type cytochrome/quinol oxidase subunit 1
MTSNRVVAFGAAVVFGVVGVGGLIVSAVTSDASDVAARLPWEFGTSFPLAALHLVLAAGLAFGCIRGDARARIMNTTSGCVLFALGMFGLFAVGSPLNVLGLTGASNLLHFAASATLLAAGIGAAPLPVPEDRHAEPRA